MAEINRDLREHVQQMSHKYAFDFEREKPLLQELGDEEVDESYIDWDETSQFSKSEVPDLKPKINVLQQ